MFTVLQRAVVRLAPFSRASQTRHLAYGLRREKAPKQDPRDAQPTLSRESESQQPKPDEMILSILRKNAPLGLTSREIFEKAIAIWPPGPPLPVNEVRAHRSTKGKIIQPMPEPLNHPLRSVRYLKKHLDNLESQQIIKLIYGPVDEAKLTMPERIRLTNNKGRLLDEPKAFRWKIRSQPPPETTNS